MITVDLAIIHPATGESLTGKITFTPTSAHVGQVITHDGAIVSGVPVTVDLAEQSSVELHPTPPGWWYTVKGRDETGYTFTDHRAVPSQLPGGQESIALADLRRVDPKAGGLSVTPEPEWQQWAREIVQLGGIPGESAKETAEKVEGRQLSDQEFINLITGPRGDAGEDASIREISSPVIDSYGNNVSSARAYIIMDRIAVVSIFLLSVEIPQAGDQDVPLVRLHSDLGSASDRDQWSAWVGGGIGMVTGLVRSSGDLNVRWSNGSSSSTGLVATFTYIVT